MVSVTTLRVCNGVASCAHLCVLIAVIALGSSSVERTTWALKRDRTLVTTVAAPVDGGDAPARDRCDHAAANIMEFGNVTLAVSSFPSYTGMDISLFWLVVSFFALSWGFQLAVEVTHWATRSASPDGIYTRMFPDILKNSPSEGLQINYLRYIEYSASASVVLLAISLVAGVNDVDILVSIAIMCASCMLIGMVAEWSFRVSHYIDEGLLPSLGPPQAGHATGRSGSYLVQDQPTQPNGSQPSAPQDDVRETLRWVSQICMNCAIVSHVVAWALIVLPWAIVLQRYMQWWESCSPDGAEQKPPDFVRVIVIAQGLLFLAFGLVQVFQFSRPGLRGEAELMYIGLSLTAKMLLGLVVAMNLF